MPPIAPWLSRALPGLLLVGALLSGGISAGERGVLLGLVVATCLALRAPRPSAAGAGRLDLLLILAVTGAYIATTLALATRDLPLGTDWYSYLKNAVAMADGEWAAWNRWRGPLHAWACLALEPVAGDLVAASQLLALGACASTIPLTWALGRLLLGRWPALWGALLLAAWPDLALFGRTSTPYPLLAALSLAGLTLAVGAVRLGRGWLGAPAGMVLGLAALTDARGTAMAVAVVFAAPLVPSPFRASPRPPRAPWVTAALVAGLALGTARAGLAMVPVELTPLAEQVALQRDLNANEGPEASGVCRPSGRKFPTADELFGPCARTTLGTNLGRGQEALPVSLAFLAALGALGLYAAGVRRAAVLALPVLPALPSLLLVGFQHRYALPLLPLGALAAGAALDRLSRAGGHTWAARLAATVVGAALMLAWTRSPATLLARARGDLPPRPGAAPAATLGDVRGFSAFSALIREGHAESDHVYDCAMGGMPMRLHPTPVVELPRGRGGTPGTRCLALLAQGPAEPGTTWLVIPVHPDDPIAPAWTVVGSTPRGGGALSLLRGAR